MPIFANVADMQARFEERDLIQLSDAEGTGLLNEPKIEEVLGSADTLIIGYIAARYQDVTSFAGHATLKDVACDYAFSLLWKTDIPEWVKDRRKLAIDTLTKISSGSFKLDQGTEVGIARADAVLIGGAERRFSRDTLKGF